MGRFEVRVLSVALGAGLVLGGCNWGTAGPEPVPEQTGEGEALPWPPVRFQTLSIASDSDMFGLGLDYSLYHSSDGGRTWEARPSFERVIMGTWFANGADGYYLHQRDGLYRTRDAGKTWAPFDPESWSGVPYIWDFPSPAVGYVFANAVGAERMGVYKTTDSGTTWIEKPIRTGDIFHGPWKLDFATADTGYCITGEFKLMATRNGGDTWAQIVPGAVGVEYHDLQVWNARNLLVRSELGRLLRSWDGGLNWSQVKPPPFEYMKLVFQDTMTGYALAYGQDNLKGSRVMKTRDGGETWTKEYQDGNHYSDLVFTASGRAYLKWDDIVRVWLKI